MNHLCRTIGMLLLTICAVFAVRAQETPQEETNDQTTQQQTTQQQTTQPQTTQPQTTQPQTTEPQTTQPQTTQQQTTQPQTTQPQTTNNQTTTQDYVFPTPKERFKRYVLSTVGPMPMVRLTFSAGIQQWRDTPEEWGQGMKGFGRRFASNFGRNLIQQTVTYGLDSALELDTGFERSKREGFWPRMKDALVQNITSRTKSGNRVISAPRLAGAYTAGVIGAETWYPDRYNWKDGLRHGTTTVLMGFGINVLREFVIKF